MTDRNTISQVIESLFEDWIDKNINVHPLAVEDMRILEADALAMLKEQETVKPKKIKGYNPPMYTLYEYKCEKCESLMMNKQPFCMGCGRAVKWE